MTLGDDFVLTGPTERLSEFQTQHDRVEPNRSKTHQLQVNKEHQNIEEKVVLRKRGIVYQHDPKHVDVLVTSDLSKATPCQHKQPMT